VNEEEGAQAAEALLHRLTDELASYSRTSLLVDIANGIDLRHDEIRDGARLAAIAYTLAFTTTRGGGGWLTFGGRDHAHQEVQEDRIPFLQAWCNRFRADARDAHLAVRFVSETIVKVV